MKKIKNIVMQFFMLSLQGMAKQLINNLNPEKSRNCAVRETWESSFKPRSHRIGTRNEKCNQPMNRHTKEEIQKRNAGQVGLWVFCGRRHLCEFTNVAQIKSKKMSRNGAHEEKPMTIHIHVQAQASQGTKNRFQVFWNMFGLMIPDKERWSLASTWRKPLKRDKSNG